MTRNLQVTKSKGPIMIWSKKTLDIPRLIPVHCGLAILFFVSPLEPCLYTYIFSGAILVCFLSSAIFSSHFFCSLLVLLSFTRFAGLCRKSHIHSVKLRIRSQPCDLHICTFKMFVATTHVIIFLKKTIHANTAHQLIIAKGTTDPRVKFWLPK